MGLFGNIIPWFKRGPALNRQTVAMEQLMKGNALWGANPDVLVTAVTATMPATSPSSRRSWTPTSARMTWRPRAA